ILQSKEPPVAKVLIGKDEGDMPTWDGGEGKPLLLDKSHRLLWTWLPYGSTGNRVCYSSGREQVVLGTIKAEQRGLVPIPLEADRQAKVESTAPADFLVSPLLSLPEAEAEAKHELSISDYLKREPELSVLRHLSLLASRHYEEFERLGSEGWLASIDWKDIFEVHTHIGRDSTLFQILKETIKTRRLVFLFGGLECGVSVFLSQFARSSSTLTADFKES